MNVSEELQQMLNQLSLQFEDVSLRGKGQARFVFARHKARALEISESEGKWWLEFWDTDPDADAAPVLELTVQTFQAAVKEATDWLACGPGHAIVADAIRKVRRK
jgi:hypothetical protein